MLKKTFTLLAQAIVTVTLFSASVSAYAHQHPHPDTQNLDVWAQLRQEFRFQFNPNHRPIRQQIRWFQRNPHYLYQTLEKAAPLVCYIQQQLMNRNMPGELVLVPFVESEYNTSANSHAGAAGLWQFMPQTATGFGMRINWWYDDRLDVQKSTQAALSYFDYLNDFFAGDWLLTVAAYDCGEGTVLKAIRRNEKKSLGTTFWQLHLPHETKDYLPKLLALVAIVKNPERYGFTLPPLSDTSDLQDVEVPAHLPLTAIAGLADTEFTQFMALNPEFKQPTTGPRKHMHILLPCEKAALFRSNLAVNPSLFKRTWLYHSVLLGDTLSGIAKKHKTTVTMLMKINQLDNTRIYQKQKLLVPNTQVALNNKVARYTYIVKTGDTLSQIAHTTQSTVAKLKAQNALHGDIIRPGRLLIIR